MTHRILRRLLTGLFTLLSLAWAPQALAGHWDFGLYGNIWGTREYQTWVPTHYSAGTPLPVVLMIHGCLSEPNSMAAVSRFNELADRENFIVVYPRQNVTANPQRCWNFMFSFNQARGSGEPSILMGIVNKVKAKYTVDAARVYVTGISSGGAMTSIMAACYSDVFAAGAVHSGGMYKGGVGPVTSAESLLLGSPFDPDVRGRDAWKCSGSPRRLMPMLVVHGTSDIVVNPVNGDQTVQQFVQTDIAAFGGDATNVTLMGQSAGAINIWALMTSPLSTGLFHKAVPISGGISLASNLPAGTLPTLNPASTYLAQGNALLLNLLVADGKAADLAGAQAFAATQTTAQLADYLRGKDGKTLLTTVLTKGLTGSGPIPDGVVVPTDPIAAMAAGRYTKVPVLAGNTADEGKLFAPFLTLLGGKPGIKIGDAERFALMASFNPNTATTLSAADILDASYLPVATPVTGYNAKTGLLGALFTSPSRDNVLNTLRAQQAQVWHYQFNWALEPAPWNEVYGAAHAFDPPFLFGNFGPSVFSNAVNSTANQPGRLALSAAMMNSLAAFARTGDPSDASLGVAWKPWPSKLLLDASLTQTRITTE